MNKLLEDAVALVTGGSSGSGRAMARRFAEEGAAAVIVADVREHPREGGTPTAELIRATGTASTFVQCDVASPENLAAAVAVADTFGDGITVMVNNAAIFRAEDFLTVTEATYTTLMDINVKGTFFGAQAAARSMINGGRRGSIINLSSLAGLQGLAPFPTYTASKGAVRMLTMSLADSLGRYGIRVNAIHPGMIDTEMTRTDVPTDTARINQLIPLGRAGTPEDVAGAAVFLASDLAAYVNGHSLVVDAGALRI